MRKRPSFENYLNRAYFHNENVSDVTLHLNASLNSPKQGEVCSSQLAKSRTRVYAFKHCAASHRQLESARKQPHCRRTTDSVTSELVLRYDNKTWDLKPIPHLQLDYQENTLSSDEL